MTQGDSLQAVLDSVFAAPEYQWVVRSDPWRWLREARARVYDWLLALRDGNPLAFRLLELALGLVFAAVLVYAGYVLWLTLRRGARAAGAVHADAPREPRDAEWHLRQADAAAAAGRHRDAFRLAFAALALRLDSLGRVRWAASKTPAEFAREARLAPDERARLRTLVATLYRELYGGAPAGADDYARWRAAALGIWEADAIAP
ncbi:MAG TPA: DUF4129 domain-containing protein [Gemmatimonadales bacterium]|nr:DUF4129 domain-containing protein [Gemmatimonadales bacterium]